MRPSNHVLSSHDIECAERCTGSACYRPDIKAPKHPGMWWGIFVHRFIEYEHKRGREYALDYIKRKYKRAYKFCSQLHLKLSPQGRVEVPYLIDVSRSEVGAYEGEYIMAMPEHHVYVKTDFVFIADMGWRRQGQVEDFKTGDKVVDPSKSWQIWCQVIAAHLAQRITNDPVAVSTLDRLDALPPPVTNWYATTTNLHSSGDVTHHRDEYGQMRIYNLAKRLQHVHAKVMRARRHLERYEEKPDFDPGPWCCKCDLQRECAHAEYEVPYEEETQPQ